MDHGPFQFTISPRVKMLIRFITEARETISKVSGYQFLVRQFQQSLTISNFNDAKKAVKYYNLIYACSYAVLVRRTF